MQPLKFSLTSTASSTFLKIACALTLLLLPSVGHCEDAQPVFTHLEKGEVAAFGGYLLSPEAVGTVITVDDERRLKELAAQKLTFDEERAGLVRQIKEKDARIERLSGEADVVAESREKEREAYRQEIALLRRRALVYGAVGALCGGALVGVASLL